MSFPQLKRRQWGLLVCAIALLLIPVGFAAATPAMAPLPKQALFIVEEAPPIPDRQKPLPDFQHLLDPLPLVVQDLPDQASQSFFAIYEESTLFDKEAAHEMLAAAERAIPVPAAYESAWNDWVNSLAFNRNELLPIPTAILESLRVDPQNGDRLSNLAVALYFAAEPQGSWESLHGGPLSTKAAALLEFVAREFPDSRGAVLNAIYLNSGVATYEQFVELTSILDEWSTNHPDDATALLLLAPLTLRYGNELQREQLEARLRQVATLSDAAYAAFGHALLGDMLQGAARTQLPFRAQQSAKKALVEYDRALSLSDDPSIYAARASMLEFLGNDPAALVTLQQAIRLHPNSVPLRLQLAELHLIQDGSTAERKAALAESQTIAWEALRLSLGQDDPLLSTVQLFENGRQADPAPAAYVWSRPHRTYYFQSPPMAGGGFVVSYELIQRFNPSSIALVDSALRRLPISRAIADLAFASVALGDQDTLEAGYSAIQEHIKDWDGAQSLGTLLEEELSGLRLYHLPAVHLVSDPNSPLEIDRADDVEPGFYTATRTLREAGLFEQAAALCRSREAWACAAENEYLAGNISEAHLAFNKLEAGFYDGQSFDPVLGLEAGMVAELAGDSNKAIRLYELGAENAPFEAFPARDIATIHLANAKLGLGEEATAIELYSQVVDHLEGISGASALLLYQRALNNRGVAQLMIHMRPGGQLDCKGSAEADCNAALNDFEAALLADPYDPVSLLGKGWVERLMGNSQESIQTLERAVELDPTLFPALNDLGVMAAQLGNRTDARKYFEAALAANPEYDLALWNLGVLNMQRGVQGLLRGQAYLARANLQNPSFVSSDLAYRFDDNVYRVEFTERSRPGAGWSFGSASSLVATAFGLVTFVTLLIGTVKFVGKNHLHDGLNKWTDAAAAWQERAFGRKLSVPTGSGWRQWIPLLITLPILAFVTSLPALRTNPETATGTVILALFAALTAVIAHELGHLVVAWKVNARMLPAQWGPGNLLALVLLPFNLSAGPFPGERIECDDERSAWAVHLGGPVANLLVALCVYGLYLLQPMPGLRLIVLAQLAAMGYALLPFEPLDGAVLSRRRPSIMTGLAFFVLLVGALFSQNIL